jgi:competence protein ComEA
MFRKSLLVLALLLAMPGAVQAQLQIQESTVRIHVSGRVQKPGVYTLPRGARGVDAIQAAGGIAKGAVLSDLNLASVLADGERLEVPSVAAPKRPGALSQAPRSQRASGQNGRSPARVSAKAPISLNKASVAELDALPGIGRTLAEEVIRYRSEKGRFRTLDELKEVPGIGERRFERLAPLLTL